MAVIKVLNSNFVNPEIQESKAMSDRDDCLMEFWNFEILE